MALFGRFFNLRPCRASLFLPPTGEAELSITGAGAVPIEADCFLRALAGEDVLLVTWSGVPGISFSCNRPKLVSFFFWGFD